MDTHKHPPSTVYWTVWHSLGLGAIVITILLVDTLLVTQLRLVAWLATKALLTAFAIVAGHGVTGLWFGLLIDMRNRVSLSRLQMLLWTIMLLSSFLAAVLCNIDAGHPDPLAVDIPPELWLLMGINISALIGSPLIVSIKKRLPANEMERAQTLAQLQRQAVDAEQVDIQGRIITNNHPGAAHLSDLFRSSELGNAGQVDLGKVQLLFFTLILLLAYGSTLVTLFDGTEKAIVALPTLDPGMIALLGLSHAGYLVNKALPYAKA